MAENANTVVAQKGALVGDEAVQDKTHEVSPEVTQEAVAAQVAPARDKDAAKVNVHETVVNTDRIITDPSSPEAVQVPDAGRGSLDLPIHALGGPTVEEVFAKEASTPDEPEDAPTPSE